MRYRLPLVVAVAMLFLFSLPGAHAQAWLSGQTLSFTYWDTEGQGRLILREIGADAVTGGRLLKVTIITNDRQLEGSGIRFQLEPNIPFTSLLAFTASDSSGRGYFFQGIGKSGITISAEGSYHAGGAPDRSARWAMVLESIGPAELVSDPDFESPDAGSQWVTYYADDRFGSWRVESGSIDLVGTYWQAARGRQSVDLSGDDAGAIYQDLATIPGRVYRLRFWLAGNPVAGPVVKTMRVWWGSALVDQLSFDTSSRSAENMGWRLLEYTVRATASTTPLRFESLDDSTNGPVLDDVSVTLAP